MGGPGQTGIATSETGGNMEDAGQATVDRCKWRKIVGNYQRCSYDLITRYQTEEEDLEWTKSTGEVVNSPLSKGCS